MTLRSPAALQSTHVPRRVAHALLLAAMFALACAVFTFSAGRKQVLAQEPTATPTPSTLVYVQPPSQSVTAGSNVVVEVRVSDVTGLGAYEFELSYFGNALNFVSVDNGPFLGSTGRTVFCLNPQTDVGTLRFGCVTLGAGAAPSGNGLLATVTLSSENCTVTSPLQLTLVGLSDTLGNPIPTNSHDATATITGASTECPTPTSTFTPTQTPTPNPNTPTVTPTATPFGPTATPGPSLCGSSGTTVCVIPASQAVADGDAVNLAIAADSVTDFGGFQLVLDFDSSLLMPVSVSYGPFPVGTGRSIFCLSSLETSRVQMACSTLGSALPGPSGNGVIALIALQARDLVAGPSALHLEGVLLADIRGAAIPVAHVVDGSVRVLGPPTPTFTATSTPTVPTSTPTNTSTPTYTPTETFTPTPCPTDGCPPTNTPTETYTPTLTRTPTNTRTPTPTITPSPTATLTPTPTPGPCAPATTTTVCIQPATQAFFLGSDTTVNIGIDSSPTLGAFQFTLVSDPSVVTLASVAVGPFLGSTGRTVACVVPSSSPGSLRFVCNTLGSAPVGATGAGVLAIATLHGNATGTSALSLQNVSLSGIDGTSLAAPVAVGGSAQVVAPATSTITPTPTITLTPTNTVTPTRTLTPTPCPTTGCPTATDTPTRTVTPAPSSTPTRTPTPSPSVTPGPLTVRIAPASQVIDAGILTSVDVTVDNVTNLGAFQFTLSFDSALLAYSSTPPDLTPTPTPLIGSTGRNIACLAPNVQPGSVTITCNTLGSSPLGADGTGVLATVSFRGLLGGISPLHLSDVVIANISAISLTPILLQDGSITVLGPTPTFTPTGTATMTPTATRTSASTPARTPTSTPTSTATFTRTASPTSTPTSTLTRTATPTSTPTRTATPTSTPTRTATPTQTPSPAPTASANVSTCPDLDGDGLVRVSDVLYVLTLYGSNAPQADFDRNGIVTISDIVYVLQRYGASC